MAEDYDPQILRDLMALIQERLGTPTAGGLTVKLKRSATRPHGVRTVQNWINGTAGPEYPSLMAMLSAARLLAPEADAVWRGAGARERDLAAEAAEAERRFQAGRESRRRRETGSG